MDDAVKQSYEYCQQLSKVTAGNFYYAFLTLPQEQFRSMCALYAFMRVTDDLGDSDETAPVRAEQLKAWRESLSRVCATGQSDHPLLPALGDVIHRTNLPQSYLTDVIDGVEMDLQPVEYSTFKDLERYCYHVAGAVGLACIHLWGYHDERAKDAAISCGTALQLTNILRDVREDGGRGRVYLPKEHLEQFELTSNDILEQAGGERFLHLMEFETELAQSYYRRAQDLFEYLDPPGRPILETMLGIYGGLLRKIASDPERVLLQRVSLSRWRKLAIAGQALARHKLRRWLAPFSRSST